MRPTIGIAVIAKNEQDNVRKFTKSLGKAFDQMIFCDTGSTDKTVEIAKELGWNVVHFEWCDDFSRARNSAFSHLTTDYACWLDLDDLLDNSEKFIQWRDSVMSSADMWFANYNYARDVRGNPTCSHARERVIRLSKGFTWKFPVHEGLVPTDPHPKINAQFATAWCVQHDRTLEDLSKDRTRNLEIFEKNKNSLESRMVFYWGKELFETGNHVAAISKLLQATSDKKLELHDRTLGLQYLVECYMKANQPDQAIAIAHQGLQLAPNRAEFYCQIGNCYVMKRSSISAIPFYSAAKACQMAGDASKNISGALFSSEAHYKQLPRNQLARCYSEHQKWEDAEREAKEAVDLYGDEESKVILSEVRRIKGSAIEITDGPREEVNEIVFTVPPGIPYEFDPDLRNERGLGGSETALVEMASALSINTGIPIKVFTPRQKRPEIVRNGVQYLKIEKAPEYFGKFAPRLHIAWRHNLPVTKAKTLVWNHDLTSVAIDKTDRYYKALALSPFHKAFLISMCGIPPEKIHVTRNGLSYSDIIPFPDVKKNLNKVIFSSSPDRGLDRAIKVVEMARETLPDLELHCFYGFDLIRNANPGLADTLERLCYSRPWVKMHGNVKKTELMRHFAESAIWLYPTNFLETSCITAMEALAYGAYPIVRQYGALQDTLKSASETGFATLIDNFAETDGELKVFSDEIIRVVKTVPLMQPGKGIDLMSNSWDVISKEWIADFLEVTSEKSLKAV